MSSMWPGFLPRETAEHHRRCVLSLVTGALREAQLEPPDMDVVCFTKGLCWGLSWSAVDLIGSLVIVCDHV